VRAGLSARIVLAGVRVRPFGAQKGDGTFVSPPSHLKARKCKKPNNDGPNFDSVSLGHF
jgi:hypothetical protein